MTETEQPHRLLRLREHFPVLSFARTSTVRFSVAGDQPVGRKPAWILDVRIGTAFA
jgi:hypothetical protein